MINSREKTEAITGAQKGQGEAGWKRKQSKTAKQPIPTIQTPEMESQTIEEKKQLKNHLKIY